MEVRWEPSIRQFTPAEWGAVATEPLGITHSFLRYVEDQSPAARRIRYGLVLERGAPWAALVMPEISGISPYKNPRGLQERALATVFRRSLLMFDVPRSAESPGVTFRPGVAHGEGIARIRPLLAELARARHRPAVGAVALEPDIESWRADGWLDLELPPLTELALTGSYDDYLGSMRKNDKKQLGRMKRRAAEAGVRFGVADDVLKQAPRLYELLTNVYAKHDAPPPVRPDVFASLAHHFGADVSVLTAHVGDELAGFLVGIRSGGTLSLPYCGLDYGLSKRHFVYPLLFEAAIRLALDEGLSRVRAGIYNYDQKRSVGFTFVKRYCVYRASVEAMVPVLRRTHRLVAAWDAHQVPTERVPR